MVRKEKTFLARILSIFFAFVASMPFRFRWKCFYGFLRGRHLNNSVTATILGLALVYLVDGSFINFLSLKFADVRLLI